jgi:LL-diaminopimelate aminotransferase
MDAAAALGTEKGYTGYGAGQGLVELRKKISQKIYNEMVEEDELFISDGAKCDIGRLQVMFGNSVTIAVQDPAYPVYVDSSVIMNQTKEWNAKEEKYNGINYLRCDVENHFFPKLNQPSDIIFFCSPKVVLQFLMKSEKGKSKC